ncbi:MAG: 3-phosphoserine/phosphohydroxythreonine transaminase [Armatimonadetes bacterium]|jgi:phosphoserine aminotransferase|nr:3-phosphoserine/phosphohydroxythreonine transaminase [Armatimonadota bacterium]
MERVYNFNAGPAALPLDVLTKAQAELVDLGGSGMSVMEMSHRSKEFQAVIDSAQAKVRALMGISEDYAVLFLQGGASLQFATIPMNLRGDGQTADFIDTGSWASKAIKEAKISGNVNVAWSGKEEGYVRVPKQDELKLTDGAAYVHICSNETIGGIRFPKFPNTDAPLVADMSSEIMSRVINVNDFGMIYAGAQKNIGPSGLALVIIRKDLIERTPDSVPIFLRYKTHADNGSLYNTPNTWGIYILKLVMEWMESLGGIAAVQKINEDKAAALYSTIDSSDFWRCPVNKADRSIMNVVWRLPSEELEEAFVAEAKKAGMIGLKGHRSVGGIRASIYNAVPKAAIDALIAFMKDFEKKNG